MSNDSSSVAIAPIYYEISDYLGKIIAPILLVFGSISNTLALITLIKSKQKNATNLYLSVLSIFEFLANLILMTMR